MSLFIIILFALTHVADQQLPSGGYDNPRRPSGGLSRDFSRSHSGGPGGPGGSGDLYDDFSGGTGPSAGPSKGPSERSYTNAPSDRYQDQFQRSAGTY